ncbi:uncharacterized protein BP5553_08924 [Venustampulla echinocandica]|uniref:Ubiquitin carboxyl-terminal hydrolase n=1 Tax=Venustampulla echinocandica TaxID=2656787 RepID=A0A370TDB5_9HELO|nr:uncharacterized protein BP5553_08924 [Venustampulla echinocandica]RDL32468.1 hypothetical protein BP5553_08924 [Venustampulla echinocandica]
MAQPGPATRTLRKRKDPVSTNDDSGAVMEAMKPLTDEERRSWKGWVELESDPALFNFILREYGVRDVKIQEVLALDDEMLGLLPNPVYGLIFLFKYRDEDEDAKAETEVETKTKASKCPKQVWFANQTTNNACATVALLNIVMNVPEINLGDVLSVFKKHTQGLKPAYRGQRLGCNDFIRSIHNSFVRRMDILNADLALQGEFERWKRIKNNPRRKKTSNTKTKPKDEDEPGYHFIAYVPIDNVVWRLDGLQRHPTKLGPSGDNWMAVARDNIYRRICQYEDDGVQFSLLALGASPLRTLPKKIAASMKSVMAVEEVLSLVLPDWKLFVTGDIPPTASELCESFGVTNDLIETTELPISTKEDLEKTGSDPQKLMELRLRMVGDYAALCRSYLEEAALIGQEDDQAAKRKEDHTPVIYSAIKKIAEAGVLKGIVADIRENGMKL